MKYFSYGLLFLAFYPVLILHSEEPFQRLDGIQFKPKEVENTRVASVVLDENDNRFVIGSASTDLFGLHQGSSDFFVAKLDPANEVIWAHQIGSDQSDTPYELKLDDEGSVYIYGTTSGGDIVDGNPTGNQYLAKFNLVGDLEWERQFGSESFQFSSGGLAIDSLGNIYVGGVFFAPFGDLDFTITKFNSFGTEIWTEEYGAFGEDDYIKGIEVDSDDFVYIAGETDGDFEGETGIGNNQGLDSRDLILMKLRAADGGIVWVELFGTDQYDFVEDLAVSSFNELVICGASNGDFATPVQGFTDPIVGKFDSDGNCIWKRQFGTPSGQEEPHAISFDSVGNLFVGGTTTGNLFGPRFDATDAWFCKLDNAGEILWGRQFGEESFELVESIAISVSGNPLVAGSSGSRIFACTGNSSDLVFNGFLLEYGPDLIEFESNSPSTIEEGVNLSVLALDGDPLSGSAQIVVDTGSGFQAKEMNEQSANVYSYEFEPAELGTEVRYYFSSLTTSGTIENDPVDAPNRWYSVAAGSLSQTVYATDFEDAFGWQVSGNATTGNWEAEVPVGTGKNSFYFGAPLFDADGSGKCFLTENESGNSDVDNGETILTSPAFDGECEIGELLVVSYSLHIYSTAECRSEDDVFIVELSNNDGQTWVGVEEIGPSGSIVRGGFWFRKIFRPSVYLTNSSQMRVRFRAEDNGNPDIIEAAIDDFKVLKLAATGNGILGDVNQDGEVNLLDVAPFVDLLVSGNFLFEADVNEDGSVDLLDVAPFVELLIGS